MTARKALAARRADFVAEVIDTVPSRSRARELVESGALDHAADIAELAHDLTDGVIREMAAEFSARRWRAEPADIRVLRSIAFKAIVYAIIDRLERGERR